MSFDPRIEDVKAIYQLYKSIFQPFINQDAAWVSSFSCILTLIALPSVK